MMTYLVVWSGGADAAEFKAFASLSRALANARKWDRAKSDGETIEILRIGSGEFGYIPFNVHPALS